jgi:hypothetical protein
VRERGPTPVLFAAMSDRPSDRSDPIDPLIGTRRLPRRLASIEAAAIAGIVCGVGWALSLGALLDAPGPGAGDEEIRQYYAASSGSAALVWLQVLVVSTIAFMWFVGVVRGRVGDREPRLFGTVFFGASILLAILLFSGAALLAAPSVMADAGRTPDPDVVSMTRTAAAVLLGTFAPRIATLVMFSTAALGRVTGALPRWLVWVTYLVGAIEFVNVSLATPSLLLVPAWIIVVSIQLLVRRPGRGLELPPPPSTVAA